MANYYAAARSNYVHVDDKESLQEALNRFGNMNLIEKEKGSSLYCILCEEGWPGWGTDEDGYDVEFDPEKHIMPFVREGEVFVMMESGHEKLHYIVGVAAAYRRNGDAVCSVSFDLTSIYQRAANNFQIDRASITRAEY